MIYLGGFPQLKIYWASCSNSAFSLISEKITDDNNKYNDGKTQSTQKEKNYAEKIDNNFAHQMTNIVTIRAFLEKYGYAKYWNKWVLKELYDTYAILKTKNFE